jgi:predicted RNase H-like HicB family nuclease
LSNIVRQIQTEVNTSVPGFFNVGALPLRYNSYFSTVKRTIQVRIFKGESQYVAECLDLPVVTQAPTLDQLAANIREAIALHLEGEDLAELGLANDPTVIATMELDAVA